MLTKELVIWWLENLCPFRLGLFFSIKLCSLYIIPYATSLCLYCVSRSTRMWINSKCSFLLKEIVGQVFLPTENGNTTFFCFKETMRTLKESPLHPSLWEGVAGTTYPENISNIRYTVYVHWFVIISGCDLVPMTKSHKCWYLGDI